MHESWRLRIREEVRVSRALALVAMVTSSCTEPSDGRTRAARTVAYPVAAFSSHATTYSLPSKPTTGAKPPGPVLSRMPAGSMKAPSLPRARITYTCQPPG